MKMPNCIVTIPASVSNPHMATMNNRHSPTQTRPRTFPRAARVCVILRAAYRAIPADLRTCGPADLRTCGPADLRTCGPADLRTCGPADLRTCGPADLRTCGPADLRTCGPGERFARIQPVSDGSPIRPGTRPRPVADRAQRIRRRIPGERVARCRRDAGAMPARCPATRPIVPIIPSRYSRSGCIDCTIIRLQPGRGAALTANENPAGPLTGL